MKLKIKSLGILFCCFVAVNVLFAQSQKAGAEKDTVADIQKHLMQLKGAYSSNSSFVFAAEKNYIIENLNFRVLYNLPIYKEYVEYWAGIYQFTTRSKEQFETQFKDDILKTLARLVRQKETAAASNLAKDLINFNTQMGFDNNAFEIAEYIQSVDSEFVSKNKNLSRTLAAAQIFKYRTPPKIVGLKEDTYKNCFIIFFDSDCDHCQVEIDRIIKNYDKFKQYGIRVISIAADIDKTNYEKYSAKFPWKDKLCDFKGLDGENFNNYGVVGTPTVFLTDKNGKIIDTPPQFEDIFK